ncbi:hypothetical protein LLEC1_07631 [Akanthomyces lecanii]|uniref:Uncharacterized protein n=1 Tax=Cordyceps confragosa TaxID=2714763 RepID=A0A179IIH9_CORDF|nr:hypothetical protein LLEC1_07631 [Akanthomyces lecanii]
MGSVQLPTVAICSQQTGLQADLRTALRFCNHSSDHVAISSTDDILRLRKDEKLWIIPASGCRLRILLKLLGRVSGQSLDMNEVARWVESCDIWERLRLRLRYCETAGDSTLEFSLQHSDLSASLMCPPTAAKTELQSMHCQITITSSSKPRRGSKRKRDDLNESGDAALFQSWSDTSLTSALNSQDRSAVHDFVRSLTKTMEHVPGEHFENILQAAVTALVTGAVRHFTGVKVTQGNIAHALVKLCPAVFHVPYIENISSRAQHMPTITSALAVLRHSAQSPALKRKIERLVDRGGIEKHLWHSTLAQIRRPSVPGPKMVAAKQYGQETMETTVMGHDLGSGLVCFDEGLFSTDLRGGMNSGFGATCMEETPSPVQIDYDALENMLPSTETLAEAPVRGGRTQLLGVSDSPIELGSGYFMSEPDLRFKDELSNCN